MKAEQGPEAGTVVGGAEEGETRLLSQTVPEEALVVHRSLTWIHLLLRDLGHQNLSK